MLGLQALFLHAQDACGVGLQVRAPGAEVGLVRDDPVALADVRRSGGAGGEDFEAGFVAGDGAGEGGAKVGGKGREGRVAALHLVDVCGVERGGEGAECEKRGVRRGNGVLVHTLFEERGRDMLVVVWFGRGGGAQLTRGLREN